MCPSVSVPLPQSLVFRCTMGMIRSPQALSQVGGIHPSCVSHGMWFWILGTVQIGQPLRTILPLEWTQVTLKTATVSAKWVGSVEKTVSRPSRPTLSLFAIEAGWSSEDLRFQGLGLGCPRYHFARKRSQSWGPDSHLCTRSQAGYTLKALPVWTFQNPMKEHE